MDRLAATEAFVRVAERGGFTAAAEALGISRAMVSKHVQDLEQHLGARLLNRTTRRISLTEAGRIYLERGAQLLADLAETEEAVGALHTEPRGRLRVNAPMSFGALHLGEAIAGYLEAHQAVTIELTLNDRVVDLVEEGYDVAIRIAALNDSSLIARRLAPSRMVVCASPGYLARHGRPEAPQDLGGHNCLEYSYGANRGEWQFERPDGAVSVRVGGRMRANNGDALRAAALCGCGVVLIPTFIVGDDLRDRRLTPLLCDYRIPDASIYAVYPPGRQLSAKVRSFIDFLLPRFGEHPSWDEWMASVSGHPIQDGAAV